MQRSKLVAIITGAISIILAIAYLLIVQILDFRGEMLPAPQSQILQPNINYQLSIINCSIAPQLPFASPALFLAPSPFCWDNFQLKIFQLRGDR